MKVRAIEPKGSIHWGALSILAVLLLLSWNLYRLWPQTHFEPHVLDVRQCEFIDVYLYEPYGNTRLPVSLTDEKAGSFEVFSVPTNQVIVRCHP